MATESPCTPMREHPITSPIWDCSITMIEAFFPEESDKASTVHACIERMPSACALGLWSSSVASPDADKAGTVYTTEEIQKMIDNPIQSKAGRRHRESERNEKSQHLQQADVCSVRVRYNDVHMFLDRDTKERSHWSNGDFHLSTAQIKSILVSGECW
ncbi:hypothetical protein BKA63DRAFT_196277 [Paraphoma chrysanthemicola]|nr:hypothetical protein BKA63DRAFT_196277 [Paraphoma chrysanthemicola]